QGESLTITKKFSPPHLESSISFNIHAPALGQQIQTKIWDDVVDTIEVNQALSQWFTDHLNMNVKLVSFPEKNSRPVDPDYKVNDEHVSLADGFPFLIIGQSSLDDLNSRMEKPVPMNRFRPNLVFTGGAPYEEDGWRNFSIGKTRFVGVKPCSRCVLTTVNQDTGEKGIEPLYTLSTYRKQNNKVLFGQNAVALDDFEVSVGDKITLN
ncbi:MAG: MOSC domain-containing protein, partial [Bacteroidota bacterium]